MQFWDWMPSQKLWDIVFLHNHSPGGHGFIWRKSTLHLYILVIPVVTACSVDLDLLWVPSCSRNYTTRKGKFWSNQVGGAFLSNSMIERSQCVVKSTLLQMCHELHFESRICFIYSTHWVFSQLWDKMSSFRFPSEFCVTVSGTLSTTAVISCRVNTGGNKSMFNVRISHPL